MTNNDQKPPREWWIQFAMNGEEFVHTQEIDDHKNYSGTIVHVIEYSAYESVKMTLAHEQSTAKDFALENAELHAAKERWFNEHQKVLDVKNKLVKEGDELRKEVVGQANVIRLANEHRKELEQEVAKWKANALEGPGGKSIQDGFDSLDKIKKLEQEVKRLKGET